MQKFLAIAILLACSCVFAAQTDPVEKARSELQQLFADLNKAVVSKDRAGLERVYAEEFLFVHTTGRVVTRAEHIAFILRSEDPTRSNPVATPNLDGLRVYGDVAILRSSIPGVSGVNIYARKNGRWQIIQIQGTRLAPERKPVTIDPKIRDSYVGKYEFSPGAFAIVTVEDNQLKWKGGARAKVTLVPLSENQFFAEEQGSEMTFTRTPDGKVTGVTLRLGTCQESTGKRVV